MAVVAGSKAERHRGDDLSTPEDSKEEEPRKKWRRRNTIYRKKNGRSIGIRSTEKGTIGTKKIEKVKKEENESFSGPWVKNAVNVGYRGGS